MSQNPISSDDLAARFGLGADELRKPCEERLFSNLANFINPWREIFSSLLSRIDIDDINNENNSEQAKRIAALHKWKERKGSEATYKILVRALLDNGVMDQAESMCKLLARKFSQQAPSGTPGALDISHSLPTSAQLSWTPVPEDQQNGIITGYRVQVVGPDSIREISVTDASATSIEVSGLSPYTTYTFNVSAVTVGGTGPAISVSSTTPQGGDVHERINSEATDFDKSESIIEFRCPCGECSLETYLQEGCPKSCIPYLGMATLSKGDQENYNYILKKDTKKIMKSFADLSNRTCDSLVQQGVTVEKLVRVAANFNTSLRDQLVKMKSIDSIFTALATEMSFFNHDILTNIIEELGDEHDKKRLSHYSEEFKEFCKRKVFEVEPGHCACGQSLSQLKGRKLFAVVLPQGEKTIMKRLGDAVNIKETLADVLDIPPAALHLHRIDRGSVILVFSVPDCIAKKLFPLPKEKSALLRVKGIIFFVPQELRSELNQVEDMKAFSDGTDAGKPPLVERAEAQSVLMSTDEGASTKNIDYNCFACHQLLRNPQFVLCCHSILCLECINTIQAEGKPCPSCQQPDFAFVPNLKLRRFCQKTCPYCKNFTSSFEDVESNHWPECPFIPISCPNMCSIRPQRQNVEAHLEKDCPFTLVDCDLKSEIGCQTRLPRVEMFAHIITHVVPQSLQDALQRALTWYTTFKEVSYHENLPMSKPKGSGYECEFAEPVPSAFQTKCLICMEILREPYTTSCCGKSFCLFCIKDIKDNNKPCPHCQCPKYAMIYNKGLQQSLIQLQVFCSNKEGGCQWKGELSQLENHLNLNPKPNDQMTGCSFAEIKCKYCSKMFKRNEIDKHQSDVCTERPSGIVVGITGHDFATLSPHNLSREEKEKLYERLCVDSEDMIYKCQKLFTSTRKSLNERGVKPAELTQHLILLGSIKPTYKDSGLPPFRHQLPGLADAKTTDAIMSVVKDYCSFFNYRMLEYIINILGTKEDKKNLAIYKEDFDRYCKRRIFVCPSKFGEMSEEGYADVYMTVLLDELFDNCTMNHLYSFSSELQKTNNLPSIKFCHITPG